MTTHHHYCGCGPGVGGKINTDCQSERGVTMENTGSDVSSADLDLDSLGSAGGGGGPSLSLERNVVRRRRSLLAVINRRKVRSLHEVEFEICRPQPMSRYIREKI